MPDEFTSKTPLPRKKKGSAQEADTSGGAESNANPKTVRRYGTFHGDPFKGNVQKSESDPYGMKSSGIKPSIPEGVDEFDAQLPKKK